MGNEQVFDHRLRHCAPILGQSGAVAAAHPLAVQAGQHMLSLGGTAVDAAIAAQAAICVAMPNAASLGGDLLALIRTPQAVTAIGGTGLSPRRVPGDGFGTTGGAAVTVPGLVDGWLTAHAGWGRLPLSSVLQPAATAARDGIVVDAGLADAVDNQRDRLLAGGGQGWPLLSSPAGKLWRQPELAELLMAIGREGFDAFYNGRMAAAVAAAIGRCGGSLVADDLTRHQSLVADPVTIDWHGGRVHVQPPPTQGVLLAMSLAYLQQQQINDPTDHLLIELTGAAFEHRANCGVGVQLLREQLTVDHERASGRGGPRSYLHTAGVATADAHGMVVSSLISVFDDFGSAVFVPEGGFVLNNRAAGFTTGANAAAPAKRPVHTLAPAMLEFGDGAVLALATPGADGQVQTLLQLITALRRAAAGGQSAAAIDCLGAALAALRWRSEDGGLLIEAGHPARDQLERLGHRVVERTPGEDLFGSAVAAGIGVDSTPFAAADWRRTTGSGAV